MKKLSRVFGFALAGVVLSTGAAFAEARDVFGREIPVGEGRPTLVFHSNQETRKVLREHAFDLAFDLRELDPVVVVRVDLRGVPSFFRGTAKKEVRKAYTESVAFMEDYSRKHGVEPSPGEVRGSFYMVPDYTGAAQRAQGLPKGFRSVLCEVRDGSGNVVTTARFPEERAKLERALQTVGNTRLSSR